MRVFALGDPHLSFARPKPMHIFGEHWRDHARKIADAWAALALQPGENGAAGATDDVLILAGDLSWAMKAEDVQPDLDWIANLRGRKIIIRGNHDFWWHSINKVRVATGPTVEPLQASCCILNRVAFVGTRGWQCPGTDSSLDLMERIEQSGREASDTSRESAPHRGYTEQDLKIYQREVGRLRIGLEQAHRRAAEFDHLVVILHYPPMNSQHEPSGFTDLLDEYQATWCVYGHLHGDAIATAFNGQRNATRYQLVSADSIHFTPFRLF